MQLEITSKTYWIATQPVDFRKGINGLCRMVIDQLSHSLNEGVFVFYSKDRKKIKVLCWHRNGFILLYKQLAKGKFYTKVDPERQVVSLDKKQLSWLLAGLDWEVMSAGTDLPFQDYY